MNPNPIQGYVQTARKLAKKYHSNIAWTMFRLLYCRLRYGFGHQDFGQFAFYPLPLSAPNAYIKHEELNALQNLVNSEEARELVNDKVKFLQRCDEYGLSTPAILGVVSSDQADHSPDGPPHIRTAEQFLKIVNERGAGRYLLKPMRGSRGQGIQCIEVTEDKVSDVSGEPIDIQNFLNDLMDHQSLFILQKYLFPHPELRPIMPGGCLGTARMLTINTDGAPRVYLACYKVPTGDNVTDNFHFATTGNLVGEVDLESGRLLNVIGPDPQILGLVGDVAVHPDSGVSLQGFEIPCWGELVSLTEDAAKAFHELGTVGWDVALTEDGPCLIEGNSHYGCEQVVVGRGQKAEFEELFRDQAQ